MSATDLPLFAARPTIEYGFQMPFTITHHTGDPEDSGSVFVSMDLIEALSDTGGWDEYINVGPRERAALVADGWAIETTGHSLHAAPGFLHQVYPDLIAVFHKKKGA